MSCPNCGEFTPTPGADKYAVVTYEKDINTNWEHSKIIQWCFSKCPHCDYWISGNRSYRRLKESKNARDIIKKIRDLKTFNTLEEATSYHNAMDHHALNRFHKNL